MALPTQTHLTSLQITSNLNTMTIHFLLLVSYSMSQYMLHSIRSCCKHTPELHSVQSTSLQITSNLNTMAIHFLLLVSYSMSQYMLHSIRSCCKHTPEQHNVQSTSLQITSNLNTMTTHFLLLVAYNMSQFILHSSRSCCKHTPDSKQQSQHCTALLLTRRGAWTCLLVRPVNQLIEMSTVIRSRAGWLERGGSVGVSTTAYRRPVEKQ
ncbi:hypothetical protein J6590_071410 [Homalodisca vitripennis]|nr:hypothetical protein J6590_071410 [Homalodisca vitripennis]